MHTPAGLCWISRLEATMKANRILKTWRFRDMWGGGWDDPHLTANEATEQPHVRGRDVGLRIARREQ
jgi:hypothetical protein